MKWRPGLRRDQRGVTAVEFALICPIFFGLLIGISQLGMLFFAAADLRNAVASGARRAQVFPRPSTTVISQTIQNRFVNLRGDRLTGPNITYANDANGFNYADIAVSYAVPLNFVIYVPPPITLTERRRVFLAPAS
jgi:Flp pilus assembly protein TadG